MSNYTRLARYLKDLEALSAITMQENSRIGQDVMLRFLRESTKRKHRDRQDLLALEQRHGEAVVSILQSRAEEKSLSERDRQHWQRLLELARKTDAKRR